MKKASDFEVGERVHDAELLDNGTVTLVGPHGRVVVQFDGADEFPFEEGIDLKYLAHGEAPTDEEV